MIRASLRLLLVSLSLAPAMLGGCTVDSVGNPGGGPDASTSGADADDSRCTVPRTFGAVGELGGATAEQANQPGSLLKLYRLSARLDDAEIRDALSLSLWEDRGIFAGGVPEPGTYTLAGAETSFDTCGACVTIVGDIVPMQGPTQFFIAQGGTLQIDSVQGTLAGSLSNVTFAEFELGTGALVTGGCETTITSASFTATVQVIDP
jgi:hypothetical protein